MRLQVNALKVAALQWWLARLKIIYYLSTVKFIF